MYSLHWAEAAEEQRKGEEVESEPETVHTHMHVHTFVTEQVGKQWMS
jgi:hypothetical protein